MAQNLIGELEKHYGRSIVGQFVGRVHAVVVVEPPIFHFRDHRSYLDEHRGSIHGAAGIGYDILEDVESWFTHHQILELAVGVVCISAVTVVGQ